VTVTEELNAQHSIIATFNLDNCGPDDEGEYVVISTNIRGNLTAVFTLEVLPYEQTPPPPTAGLAAASLHGCIMIVVVAGLMSVATLNAL
jgi:hypothetical protein